MYFLIDFENVHNGGMKGAEYLLPLDHIIIFFSEAANTMELRHLEIIRRSGCTFEICKLLTSRKNALDFYIATRVGELFGTGTCKKLVLVSRDEGFKAVQEYWKACAPSPHQVFLTDSIESRMVAADEPSERALRIQAEKKTVKIEAFFAGCQKDGGLKRELEVAFAGTELSARVGEMEDILKTGKAAREVYLHTLRTFGQKNGLTVYQTLKRYIKR